jgi:hypothetical protein
MTRSRKPRLRMGIPGVELCKYFRILVEGEGEGYSIDRVIR